MQQEPGNGDQTGQRPPTLWELFRRTPDWSVLFSMHFVTGNNMPLRLSIQDCHHQSQQWSSNKWGSLGWKTQNNLFYSGCHQLDLATKSKQPTHFLSDHRVACWRVERPMIWGRLSFQMIIVCLAMIASDTSSHQWRCIIYFFIFLHRFDAFQIISGTSCYQWRNVIIFCFFFSLFLQGFNWFHQSSALSLCFSLWGNHGGHSLAFHTKCWLRSSWRLSAWDSLGPCGLTNLAPDCLSPPALFPYHVSPDCSAAAG